MNALPLVNWGSLLMPYLIASSVIFAALLVGLFFVKEDILKRLLSLVVGIHLLLAGGLVVYMALSAISVCLSGQASTSAANNLLQNYQKLGWWYLLPIGVMGLVGLLIAWLGGWFFRPIRKGKATI